MIASLASPDTRTCHGAPVALLKDLEAALVAERRRVEARSAGDRDLVVILATIDRQIAPIRTELARRQRALAETGGDQ